MTSVLTAYGSIAPQPSRAVMISHGLSTTPGMVGVITALVAGGLGAVIALAAGLPVPAVLLIAGLAFGVTMLAGFIFGFRAVLGRQARAHALFPTPTDGPGTPSSPRTERAYGRLRG